MPALPVRRTLITGMRSYPVPRLAAHRRHARRARLQPRLGLAAGDDRDDARRRREDGLRDATTRSSTGPRFPECARPGARSGGERTGAGGIRLRDRRRSSRRQRRHRAHVHGAASPALGEVEDGDSFFVAVDPFDPVDAVEAPPIYVRPGEVEKRGHRADERPARWSSTSATATRKPLRSAYRDHVEDGGRLGRAGCSTSVPGRHARATCSATSAWRSATTSFLGRGTPTSHRRSYEIPYLIRHPDGEKGGDDVDWYASTHDVAPTLLSHLGLTDPGQDARRGPDARCSTTWTRRTSPTGPTRSPRAAS